MKRVAKRYASHLHYLPPYSPVLNAIEPLWQWARQEVTRNTDYPSFAAKKQTLTTFFHIVANQLAALYAQRETSNNSHISIEILAPQRSQIIQNHADGSAITNERRCL